MSDTVIRAYLESHAPIERFYPFSVPGDDGAPLKFVDEGGSSWSVMEDNDRTVAAAAEFLRRAGARVFSDFNAMQQFETTAAERSRQAAP